MQATVVKRVTLTGITPLLMHRADMSFPDRVKAWQKDPKNAAKQVKGDDRSPAWTWLGGVYHDGKHVGIPSDNLMTMMREGGLLVPTGKKSGTYKRQSQSGLVVMEPMWDLILANGKKVAWKNLEALLEEENFDKHITTVQKLGFDIHLKRCPVTGKSKHVRARAIFAAEWEISGTIGITDDSITDVVFENILTMGGDRAGLCDWRPSSPTSPGPYGRFIPTIENA